LAIARAAQATSDRIAKLAPAQSAEELDLLPVWTVAIELGIEKPIVLGYSFGGFVAQSYAIRHPDHPAKLILYSTAPVLLDDPVLDAFEAIGGVEARAVAA
jgi:pimeloyl-ACP methyl ester carboxylesterase